MIEPHSDRDIRFFSLKKKHIRQYDEEFLKFTNATPNMSILEIGCGTGIFSRYLLKKGFINVVCLDPDKRLAPALSNLDPFDVVFEEAETYLSTISCERTFDLIVLHDVLEHLPLEKACSIFKALQTVLNTDGRILLRVPNLSSPWGARLYYGTFDHITPYSPDRVREFARLTDFNVIKMIGQKTGKKRKQLAANVLQSILSHILPETPKIWEANILALLKRNSF